MGEAKRKARTGARVSYCRTCTLCCRLPDIAALDKPMYRPCHHIADQGCGIFGEPERPAACVAYHCAYVSAQIDGSPERRRIPHPLDAGAYFHRDPFEKVFVVFVDPDRPEIWKRSGIVEHIRPFVGRGWAVVILDRGRRMTVKTAFHFEEILKRDYIALADAQGMPKDIESFEAERTPTS